jgi:hypothetical protein
MNEKFVSTNFIVSQLKDREQRLKKDYNAVKLILSKSGFGWDTNLNMATTILENWDELPENLQRWKDKSFPYYDEYREMAAEEATREAYTYSQFSTLETQTAGEAPTSRDAHACSEPQTAREEQTAKDTSGSKKSKRNNGASMDELISLWREELEAYNDLTERELQLKQRRLENNDPNNDPYSMAKCMVKLKNLSLPQADHLKAIFFLKEIEKLERYSWVVMR